MAQESRKNSPKHAKPHSEARKRAAAETKRETKEADGQSNSATKQQQRQGQSARPSGNSINAETTATHRRRRSADSSTTQKQHYQRFLDSIPTISRVRRLNRIRLRKVPLIDPHTQPPARIDIHQRLPHRHIAERLHKRQLIRLAPSSTGTTSPSSYPSFAKVSAGTFITRFPNGPSVPITSPCRPASSTVA